MSDGPAIVLAADWVLTEERGTGAPEAIYGVDCMTCEARSPLFDDDHLPVAVWAIQHTQQEPTHTLFLSRVEKHWRVLRRPEPEPATGNDRRSERIWGPVFVGLMCLLTAAAGFLPALGRT
ncbi:hypothetical protein SAMN06297387_1147 [Streptomyces zhaozhouensis]|uniref:DUF7848 domain-containing protein n=1 Tax=Streptomyces zhaozhouensis TaxID=1300267 RepID=A0A286DZD7_9ACTN|nr:hypothetical protein [Streptomyces zhaozhouensis]SOD64028.1 hypothetical protein SAMN06297387_1147 [Streptomyces zhaozhouensis]